MDDTAETTILEEGNVKITNRRAIISSKTYSLSDITSVKRVAELLDPTCGYFIGHHGAFLLHDPVLQGVVLV